MPTAKDIAGKTFGRLTAIRFNNRKDANYYWLFKCQCGTYKVIRRGEVSKGIIKSCGCLSPDTNREMRQSLKHGQTRTRFYRIFYGIKTRCGNKKDSSFLRYGKKGVKCFWQSFEQFREDMYESYKSHVNEFGEKNTQIDRINSFGEYSKENCRWATIREQARNKRNNVSLTFEGKTRLLVIWAEELGFKPSQISDRLRRGWDIRKALTQPLRKWPSQ